MLPIFILVSDAIIIVLSLTMIFEAKKFDRIFAEKDEVEAFANIKDKTGATNTELLHAMREAYLRLYSPSIAKKEQLEPVANKA